MADDDVTVALAVRFLLELGALAALAYWGYRTGTGFARYALALGAPLAAAVVWGVLVAPKSSRRLPRGRRSPP